MINKNALNNVQSELEPLFAQLSKLQDQIRDKLREYADGKTLKGNEVVGWLGEIYGKLLLGGKLVSDSEEHDVVIDGNQRISVKTRKGWNGGWKQSSAIPKIEGHNCPTHLLFVHLNDDYSVDKMWFFEWSNLIKNKRFKSHVVRGSHRSFIFTLDEQTDNNCLIFISEVNNISKTDNKDNLQLTSHVESNFEINTHELSNYHGIMPHKFNKINRIELWSNRPHQFNHKIVKAFLELEKRGRVRFRDFRSICSDRNSKYYVNGFDGHYASMKTDSGNSHGNVFFDINGIVNIWPKVRGEVRKYFENKR